jgi:protein-S-isoprenylcysteine O-methyltransferase Ste14
VPAWTVDYWQAWVYWLLASASILFITLYFLRRDPQLMERRLRAGPRAEQQKQQRVIQSFSSAGLCSLFVMCGLDHYFGWSSVPPGAVAAGNVLVLLSFAGVFFVFRQNTYTSGTIAVDTAQAVVSTGLYGVVRHPMYLATLLLLLATPPALGSWWGLAAWLAMLAAIVSRLLDEERFLVQHLAGYPEYREQVRHRLIPGVW